MAGPSQTNSFELIGEEENKQFHDEALAVE